eukprot:5765940-Prymnesium_polylepis.1
MVTINSYDLGVRVSTVQFISEPGDKIRHITTARCCLPAIALHQHCTNGLGSGARYTARGSEHKHSRNYGWFCRPAPSRCEFTPVATPREVFTADRAAGSKTRAGTQAVASTVVRAVRTGFEHVG